jgi:invasion protein IalB
LNGIADDKEGWVGCISIAASFLASATIAVAQLPSPAGMQLAQPPYVKGQVLKIMQPDSTSRSHQPHWFAHCQLGALP